MINSYEIIDPLEVIMMSFVFLLSFVHFMLYKLEMQTYDFSLREDYYKRLSYVNKIWKLMVSIVFTALILETGTRYIVYKSLYFMFLFMTDLESIKYYTLIWFTSLFSFLGPLYLVLIIVLQLSRDITDNLNLDFRQELL